MKPTGVREEGDEKPKAAESQDDGYETSNSGEARRKPSSAEASPAPPPPSPPADAPEPYAFPEPYRHFEPPPPQPPPPPPTPPQAREPEPYQHFPFPKGNRKILDSYILGKTLGYVAFLPARVPTLSAYWKTPRSLTNNHIDKSDQNPQGIDKYK
nr:extensin-like [Maniola hyperantus]